MCEKIQAWIYTAKSTKLKRSRQLGPMAGHLEHGGNNWLIIKEESPPSKILIMTNLFRNCIVGHFMVVCSLSNIYVCIFLKNSPHNTFMHNVLPIVVNFRDDLYCSLQDARTMKQISMLGRFLQISATMFSKKLKVFSPFKQLFI